MHALVPMTRLGCWHRWPNRAILCAAAGFAGCSGRRLRAVRLVRAARASRGGDDGELAESLKERSLLGLDFEYIMSKLREQCYTAPGAALTGDPAGMLAQSPEEARKLYDAVLELAMLEDADLDLEDPLDIEAIVESCARGTVPEGHELQHVSAAIEAFLKLRTGIERAADQNLQIPTLLGIVQRLELPDELLDIMLFAFQEEGDGELAEEKFPEIAEMREKVRQLEERCVSVIQDVLSGGRCRNYLSDDGYMQVDGKYVLSVKPEHAKKVGRVVGESRSGRESYVEPRELLGPASELDDQQRDYERAVRLVLSKMSVAVSRGRAAIEVCLEAAGEIDMARARLFLGEDMEGEVPEVGNEGVIMARHARNPCLLLRGGTRVVGNRIEIGMGSHGLILSGPNAGGKTVVLKTVGLLALLARCGIPVPGGESPRVDFFNVVLAEIGDMQAITDGLSTYSAHLLASRIMLSVTEGAADGASLVMMDEAGTGTDPQQGAALARAVLEALLDNGARVVATTHSVQLKNWALGDARTDVAAMEYRQGRPTFKLLHNSVGESHAIETAKRLELPFNLILRAEELLDEDQRALLHLERKVSATQTQLKQQLEKSKAAEDRATAAQRRAKDIEHRVADKGVHLTTTENNIAVRQTRLQSQHQAANNMRLKLDKKKLEDICVQLNKDAIHGDGTMRIVGNVLDELRLERDEFAFLELQMARQKQSGKPAQKERLKANDWIVVAAPHTPWYGFKGQVIQAMDNTAGPPRFRVKVLGTNKVIEVAEGQLNKTKAPPPVANPVPNRGLKRQPNRGSSKAPAKRDYSNIQGW